MIAALLVLLAVAEEPRDVSPYAGLPGFTVPEVEAVEPVDGQCARSFDLVAGQPPPEGLIGPDGLVRCTATAVPVSRGLTALLKADAYDEIALSAPLVARAWRREVGYWHGTTVQLRKPPPFWARPTTQRWIGRAEAYGTVALGALLVRALVPVLTPGQP